MKGKSKMETIQTIKYGSPIYFGMFEDDSNILVNKKMLQILNKAVHSQITRKTLVAAIASAQAEVYADGYTEVYDTEVRAAIAAWLNMVVCDTFGWIRLDNYFEDWQY